MEVAGEEDSPSAERPLPGDSPDMPRRAPHIDAGLERCRAAITRLIKERGGSIPKWEPGTEGPTKGNTLAKFLRGTNRNVSLETLLRIAAEQNVTVAELIGETSQPQQQPLDRQLLIQVMAAIDEHIDKTGVTIAPAEKALATMVLYETAQRGGKGFVMDDLAANVLALALRPAR